MKQYIRTLKKEYFYSLIFLIAECNKLLTATSEVFFFFFLLLAKQNGLHHGLSVRQTILSPEMLLIGDRLASQDIHSLVNVH